MLNIFIPFVAGVYNLRSKDKIVSFVQMKICKLSIAGMTT